MDRSHWPRQYPVTVNSTTELSVRRYMLGEMTDDPAVARVPRVDRPRFDCAADEATFEVRRLQRRDPGLESEAAFRWVFTRDPDLAVRCRAEALGGTPPSASSDRHVSAADEAMALSQAEQDKDPNLTKADAMSKVFREKPELYLSYRSDVLDKLPLKDPETLEQAVAAEMKKHPELSKAEAMKRIIVRSPDLYKSHVQRNTPSV